MKTVEAVVRDVFQLPDDQAVTDTDGPDTMNKWDSLGQVILFNAIEKEYGVSLGMDDAMTVENVGDLKRVLAKIGVKTE